MSAGDCLTQYPFVRHGGRTTPRLQRLTLSPGLRLARLGARRVAGEEEEEASWTSRRRRGCYLSDASRSELVGSWAFHRKRRGGTGGGGGG